MKYMIFLKKTTSYCLTFAILISLTRQKSTPESEKLRWVNIGYKLNKWSSLWETQDGRLVLSCFFHAPWQTLFFGFCISSPTMRHLRWLKFWINASRKTYIKLQKQPTRNVWPARFLILEKLFLSPEASEFPLDHLNNFNWTSFNLVRVSNILLLFSVCFLDGLKPPPALPVSKNC